MVNLPKYVHKILRPVLLYILQFILSKIYKWITPTSNIYIYGGFDYSWQTYQIWILVCLWQAIFLPSMVGLAENTYCLWARLGLVILTSILGRFYKKNKLVRFGLLSSFFFKLVNTDIHIYFFKMFFQANMSSIHILFIATHTLLDTLTTNSQKL